MFDVDGQILESVRERDIDLLIIEELYADSGFARWLTHRVFGYSVFDRLISARRSVVNAALGETDIELVFDSSSGERTALLLENKIAASPQPDQSQRYLARGNEGINAGFWNEFKSCLIAPQRYLDQPSNCEGYQSLISYQSIRKWFMSHPQAGTRFAYKAHLLNEAIEQNRRGYTPTIDDQVSDFWKSYWHLAAAEFPELRLTDPGDRAAGSCWMQFPNARLPKGCRLQHKANVGLVHLELLGRASEREQFAESKRNKIPADMDLMIAGKSLALSLDVPPLNHFEDFDSQADQAREGLRAASRLLAFANSSTGQNLLA